MEQIQNTLITLLTSLRPVVFGAGAAVALAAILSHAVRTRKISPFSPLARLSKKVDATLFSYAESRVVRAGGSPHSAPWWTLGVVVVGGLLLLSLIRSLVAQSFVLNSALNSGGASLAALVCGWVFGFLRFAILARVVSSFVGGNQYSRIWRWSYKSTDWILVPLRRIVPTLGPLDITPIVAYFGLRIVENLIVGALR